MDYFSGISLLSNVYYCTLNKNVYDTLHLNELCLEKTNHGGLQNKRVSVAQPFPHFCHSKNVNVIRNSSYAHVVSFAMMVMRIKNATKTAYRRCIYRFVRINTNVYANWAMSAVDVDPVQKTQIL